jgi:hypothetical protein
VCIASFKTCEGSMTANSNQKSNGVLPTTLFSSLPARYPVASHESQDSGREK